MIAVQPDLPHAYKTYLMDEWTDQLIVQKTLEKTVHKTVLYKMTLPTSDPAYAKVNRLLIYDPLQDKLANWATLLLNVHALNRRLHMRNLDIVNIRVNINLLPK